MKPQMIINSEELAKILARRFGKDVDIMTYQLQDALREAGLTLIDGKFPNK